MRKATRSSLKGLQTTLPFGSKQLIFSNNYSTPLKKGNYLAPLTNYNNKKTMKNLFAVKYYSTSTLLADKNTLDPTPTTTLDPTLFKKWTKEEVCSILCTDEGKGGAGLTVAKVKPLYDAGFNGTSIANIISTIKDKDKYFAEEKVKTNRDYQSISQTTLESVVHWVDNLLKTRLYHLWSAEQAKEQLCKPIDEGGVGLNEDQVLGGVNRNSLKRIMDFEKIEAIGKINNFLARKDEELAKRIYICLESIHNIRVPRILVSLSNTTITRENVQLLNLEQFYFSTEDEDRSTIIPQSTILLSSFGANFAFVERHDGIESVIQKFEARPDNISLDKNDVVLPFIAAAPGVGKSRLLKEIGSTVMKSSVRSGIPTIPLFVSFGNGTEKKQREKNIDIIQSFIVRIIYSALLQRAGNTYSESIFHDFLINWFDKTKGKDFDLKEAFVMVSYILNSKNADYYIAIDECHVIDSGDYSKDNNPLQQVMKAVGAYVSNNKTNRLYPIFAGTYYTSIHSSLKGSSYVPFFIPIKATLTFESMVTLLDDLSTKYPKMKCWRRDTMFRHYLLTFSGFPRGIEYFLQEYLQKNNVSLDEAWNLSKAKLYEKYNAIQDFKSMKLLAKYVFAKMCVSYEAKINFENEVKTFSELENIGAIMINKDPYDPNSQIAFYPTILLARMMPMNSYRIGTDNLRPIFEELYFRHPNIKMYGLYWEDIIQQYHYLLFSLVLDEHIIDLGLLFRFAKMKNSTGLLKVSLPTSVKKGNASVQIHQNWNIQNDIPVVIDDTTKTINIKHMKECYLIKNAGSQAGDVLILGLSETNISASILVIHIQCKWADSEHASLNFSTILKEMEKNNSFKFVNTNLTTHNITVIMTGKQINDLPTDLPADLVIVDKSNFTHYFANFSEQMTCLHANNFIHINECSELQSSGGK